MRSVDAVLRIACVAALALACAEPGEEEGAGAGRQIAGPGQVLFLTYCESCHGMDGRGRGRAAAHLRVPPADLTRLWERYGTPLEREPLVAYIDGRRLLTAHELREMPVWGDEFFADAPPDSPNLEMLRRRVVELLVDYLETLQTERAL